ncbi:MAG: hypothetical protein ACRDRR_14945 [Pseudonocardiaceae bacterium]
MPPGAFAAAADPAGLDGAFWAMYRSAAQPPMTDWGRELADVLTTPGTNPSRR